MSKQDFAMFSATETARLVKRKEISPVEVVESAIERVEAANGVLNVVILKGYEDARLTAQRLERRLLSGEPTGLMAGVPTLMKDLFSFKPGWANTLGGVKALRNFVPDFYSNFAHRMESADAIVIGKSNSATMGFAGTTDNKLFGPTKNPFNPALNSGGSSGGSAAVASLMVPLAEGSDAGGSIRIPSSWCGLVGYQPSFGVSPMVMRPNAFGATAPFIFEGPMARSVQDIALAMQVLSGKNVQDPYNTSCPVDFGAALLQSVEGMRIGLTLDFGVFPVDPQIRTQVEEASRAFTAAGAIVEPISLKLPYSAVELAELWCRMISAVTFGALTNLAENGFDLLGEHSDDLPDQLIAWVERAERMTLREIQSDQAMRTEVFDTLTAAFEHFDFICSPVTCCMPVPNADGGDTVGPNHLLETTLEPRIGWAMTFLTNLTGNPSAVLPTGLVAGLPVGLQLIGKRNRDVDLIAACAAFERARPWASIYAVPGKERHF